jgi:predicted O-methyltransferase YrrM
VPTDNIKINNNIPGWNTPDILLYLGELVSKLPRRATILELGAFFGRTTYVLGHNKPPTAKLFTVDPWMTYELSYFTVQRLHDDNCGAEEKLMLEQSIKQDPERIDSEDFVRLWKHFTDGIPNLTAVQEYSPVYGREWPKFDFIYHDASHEYEFVYKDLCFWFPKLKDDRVMILDDYDRSQFPGLCDAVDQYVSENNLITRMITGRNIEIWRQT